MKKVQKGAFFLVGIIMTVLLVGCGSNPDAGKMVSGGTGTGLNPAGTTKEEEGELGKVYILKEVNQETSQVLLIKVGGSYKEYVYNYNGSTVMEDRYGKVLSPTALTYGEVFEIEVSDDGSRLLSMKESDKVWVFEDVENFTINNDDEILKVGKEKYHLGDSTLVFDGQEIFSRYQLTEDDVLTLIGYKKELIAVMLQTGHGTLQFVNTGEFEGGYFVLGNVAAAKITQNLMMDVRAGSFLLSVAHDGKGGSQMVTIEPGQTTSVDLSQFAVGENKSCKLTIKVVQEGAVIRLNGEIVDVTQPMNLAYGTYRITAELNGAQEWSRLLLVSSEQAVVTIDLEATTNANNTQTSTESEDKDEEEEEKDEDSKDETKEESEDKEDEESGTDNQTNSLINEVMDMLIGN